MRNPVALIAPVLGVLLLVQPTRTQAAAQTFRDLSGTAERDARNSSPTNDGFDYVKRDVMIPMRDGVKLHTVILVPKARRARRSS